MSHAPVTGTQWTREKIRERKHGRGRENSWAWESWECFLDKDLKFWVQAGIPNFAADHALGTTRVPYGENDN